jgi:hypothetical protein
MGLMGTGQSLIPTKGSQAGSSSVTHYWFTICKRPDFFLLIMKNKKKKEKLEKK